jgi:hypothetical protein
MAIPFTFPSEAGSRWAPSPEGALRVGPLQNCMRPLLPPPVFVSSGAHAGDCLPRVISLLFGLSDSPELRANGAGAGAVGTNGGVHREDVRSVLQPACPDLCKVSP